MLNTPAEDGSTPEVNNDEQPTGVDWSTIDPTTVPEHFFKKTEAYQSLLSESIERRQRIKELEERMEQDNPQETTPQVQGENPDYMTVIQQLQDRLNSIEQTAQTRSDEVQLSGLTTRFKLSEADAKLLRNVPADQREIFAARLQPTSASTPTGNPGDSEGTTSTLAARIRNKVRGINDDTSPFSASTQSRQGGGSHIVT